MLLESYKLEIVNSECMPGAMGVLCFAHLDQDVAEAIPYVNAVLGGFTFITATGRHYSDPVLPTTKHETLPRFAETFL